MTSNLKIVKSPKTSIISSLILILISVIIGLILCEMILQYSASNKLNHDLDKGLIQYDKLLGWKLSPFWRGKHKHKDFNVQYSVNQHGFRGTFNINPKQKKIAFIGDSFTFGQGVNDKDTFVEMLNNSPKYKHSYLNFAVPGYSTDQEYLLIKTHILKFDPTMIVLVVYLGNDLYDNQLPFPLQADNAKPFFTLTNNELKLNNNPVPFLRKSNTQNNVALTKIGLSASNDHWLLSKFASYKTYELIKPIFFPLKIESLYEKTEFSNAFQLFSQITNEINQICIVNDIGFQLVLMPGKPFVENPKSKYAIYQEYFRRRIIEYSRQKKIETIDLASLLKQHFKQTKDRLFFPKEGHLTPKGHGLVTSIIGHRIIEAEPKK